MFNESINLFKNGIKKNKQKYAVRYQYSLDNTGRKTLVWVGVIADLKTNTSITKNTILYAWTIIHKLIILLYLNLKQMVEVKID